MRNAPHLVAGTGGTASLLGNALGGYKVEALIGRGAMGTVYLARDTALDRPVALKVLLGSLARNPVMVRSFHREAQAAAPLRHPCIVRIFSAGIESGTPFIAMEYVAGEPLDRFLRRKGKLPWQTALYVGAQVSKALQCAHDAGVIHRDIKPANILLDRQGRVRLADFGIARVATVDKLGSRKAGVIGTPTFMSPEQCEGAELTPATDLYSLGVVLFQMMAGHPPFRAESPHALVKQILADDAPRLNKLFPDIPDDVARLVAHLLQKEPGARPRTALQVSRTIERIRAEDGGRSAVPEALSAFVREQAVESNLRLMTPPPTRGGRREKHDTSSHAAPFIATAGKRLALAVAGLIFILMCTVGGVAVVSSSDSGPPATPRINSGRFEERSDGVILAGIRAPGFAFHQVHWVGKTLLIEARGKKGSLLDGATGIIVLDPVSRECFSVHAPRAPLTDGAATLAPLPLHYRIAPPTGDGPLSGSIFAADYSGVETGSVNLYPQRTTRAFPGESPVMSTRTNVTGYSFGPYAIPHPDGHTVCILVENPDGTSFLAEHDTRWPQPDRLGPAITPTGAPIVPASVQYDPAGRRIAFMRQRDNGEREFWIALRDDTEPGLLLALGMLDDSYAFNPDGSRVAVAVRAAGQADPEIRLVDTATGTTVARPAQGALGPEGWDPSGESIVITRGQPGQLWAVRVREPFTAHQLTHLPEGVAGTAAISPNGQWIAGVVAGTPEPAVCFVPREVEDRLVARIGQAVSIPTKETTL